MSSDMMTYDAIQIGTEYPPFEYELTEIQVNDYLASVQDDNLFYAQEGEAPSAIAAIYARWVTITGKHLPPGTIHAKQYYHFFKAVSPGQYLTTTGKIVEKYMKNDNRYVVLETTTRDDGGDLVTIGRMTVILPE